MQDVPDPDGECGVTAIFFCPDADGAKRASAALKAEGIQNGTIYDNTIPDRHIYANWDYVLAKRERDPGRLPVVVRSLQRQRELLADMCPRSLELLGRAILIPLHQYMAADDADSVVEGVRKVAAALLA